MHLLRGHPPATVLPLLQIVAADDHVADDRVCDVEDAIEFRDGLDGGVELVDEVVTLGPPIDLERPACACPKGPSASTVPLPAVMTPFALSSVVVATVSSRAGSRMSNDFISLHVSPPLD